MCSLESSCSFDDEYRHQNMYFFYISRNDDGVDGPTPKYKFTLNPLVFNSDFIVDYSLIYFYNILKIYFTIK